MQSRKRREGGSHCPGPSNSRNSVSGSLFSIRSSELRPMGMADATDMRCRWHGPIAGRPPYSSVPLFLRTCFLVSDTRLLPTYAI